MKLRVVSPRPNGYALPDYAEKSQAALIDSKLFDDVEVVEPEGSEIQILRNTGVTARKDPESGEFLHVPGNTVSRSLAYLDYDYLLQVDADIEYTPDNVKRLVDRDLDIVSAAYLFRQNTECFCAGMYPESPALRGYIQYDRAFLAKSTGLIKCDWVGAGFLLVKKHVFEACDWPWFFNTLGYFNADNAQRAFHISEDVGFCLNATGHGFDVVLDADVKVAHHIE